VDILYPDGYLASSDGRFANKRFENLTYRISLLRRGGAEI